MKVWSTSHTPFRLTRKGGKDCDARNSRERQGSLDVTQEKKNINHEKKDNKVYCLLD